MWASSATSPEVSALRPTGSQFSFVGAKMAEDEAQKGANTDLILIMGSTIDNHVPFP